MTYWAASPLRQLPLPIAPHCSVAHCEDFLVPNPLPGPSEYLVTIHAGFLHPPCAPSQGVDYWHTHPRVSACLAPLPQLKHYFVTWRHPSHPSIITKISHHSPALKQKTLQSPMHSTVLPPSIPMLTTTADDDTNPIESKPQTSTPKKHQIPIPPKHALPQEAPRALRNIAGRIPHITYSRTNLLRSR